MEQRETTPDGDADNSTQSTTRSGDDSHSVEGIFRSGDDETHSDVGFSMELDDFPVPSVQRAPNDDTRFSGFSDMQLTCEQLVFSMTGFNAEVLEQNFFKIIFDISL